VELPRLEPLWQKYRKKGLSIVLVEAARDTERATKFIEENNLTYHLLETEEENDVVDDVFNVHSFPTSFLIDRNGKIMYCHVGFEKGDGEGLEREIVGLFADSQRADR
jgi:peroxiredoxin